MSTGGWTSGGAFDTGESFLEKHSTDLAAEHANGREGSADPADHSDFCGSALQTVAPANADSRFSPLPSSSAGAVGQGR
jgi:hypothetical protein